MTSQPHIPSDDFLEEWLDTPMTEDKKEELGNLREEYENARKDALEHKKNNEYWLFMVLDYFGTGEGRTLCLMMTSALPCREEDFQNPDNKYVASTTKEYRARRKFKEAFGDWHYQGLEFLTREEFFTKYSQYLPPKLIELKDQLCYIEYCSKLHFNFS
jgi:hypothetical protein